MFPYLQSTINLDENGTTEAGVVWTGTFLDGTASGNTCTGWSSDSSNGQAGYSFFKDETWTNGGRDGCDSTYRLYCFEYTNLYASS